MIEGALQLSVKMTCVCGHVSEAEVFVMDDVDKGQAPLCCVKCKRFLLVQRVAAPRIQIVADPRKPDDQMLDVRGPWSEHDDEPKVH